MIHMVMRMKNAETDSTKPLTVRIPEEEYEYLKEYAGTRHISMNWLVAEAIAEYRSKIESFLPSRGAGPAYGLRYRLSGSGRKKQLRTLDSGRPFLTCRIADVSLC